MIEIFLRSVFIDNMVFAYFLGMCSYLAVSKNVKTAFGLGLAVCFVLTVTVPVNYLIDKYLLREGALVWLSDRFAATDLSFLSLILFIGVFKSMNGQPNASAVFLSQSVIYCSASLTPVRFGHSISAVWS